MKELTENQVTEIKKMIIVRQITDPESESIEGVADSFSGMDETEEEYISLNQEIGAIIEGMEFTCEIIISNAELIRDYYSADADFITDFEKNGVNGELWLTLEIREDGEEYATSELMELGSKAQEDNFQGIVEWLKSNNIDIIWEEKA